MVGNTVIQCCYCSADGLGDDRGDVGCPRGGSKKSEGGKHASPEVKETMEEGQSRARTASTSCLTQFGLN